MQIGTASEALAHDAVTPFLKTAFRRHILEIRQQNEQTIDRHTIDEALYAGFDATAVEKARSKVEVLRAWIAAHKDELTALQMLYAGTRPLRIALKDRRQLRDALARPPLAVTPVQLWRAFQAVEADQVKGSGGQQLARSRDPRAARADPGVHARSLPRGTARSLRGLARGTGCRKSIHFRTARVARPHGRAHRHQPGDRAGRLRQRWFGQQGSLGRAHALFGDTLNPLITELNTRLTAWACLPD
ncbi:MAG: hypothetical protein IT514_09580 [Burkholderiales bacterium]|nr:hypothetical protein [Burkholderiales bacterium]